MLAIGAEIILGNNSLKIPSAEMSPIATFASEEMYIALFSSNVIPVMFELTPASSPQSSTSSFSPSSPSDDKI